LTCGRSVGYDYLGALPVEITVAGAGGVGAPRSRDDPRRLFETLERIVSRTPIITGRLGDPLRFPDSDVIVLQPADPEPLRLLHHEIANSGIDFETSPFEYVPHCTLSQKPNPPPDEVERLLAAQIVGDFVAPTLSVYDMHAFPMCSLRWRGYLR
jgi:2'-5' RNA ligase